MSRAEDRSATREARCAAKRVYSSWIEAEEAARLLIEDLRDGKLRLLKKGNILAYQCDCCGRWHIGHDSPPGNPYNYFAKYVRRTQTREAFRGKAG